jgi:hypothetical protein
MRFHVTSFRVMRFRAPPVAAPGGPGMEAVAASDVTTPLPAFAGPVWNIGHPTAESQHAGLDHLMRIAMEQAAVAVAGDDGDGTPEAYRDS